MEKSKYEDRSIIIKSKVISTFVTVFYSVSAIYINHANWNSYRLLLLAAFSMIPLIIILYSIISSKVRFFIVIRSGIIYILSIFGYVILLSSSGVEEAFALYNYILVNIFIWLIFIFLITKRFYIRYRNKDDGTKGYILNDGTMLSDQQIAKEKAFLQAKKYLIEPISIPEYSLNNQIDEESVKKLISTGELKAFQYKEFLFVEADKLNHS